MRDLQATKNSEQGFGDKFNSRSIKFLKEQIISLEKQLPELYDNLNNYRTKRVELSKEYVKHTDKRNDKFKIFSDTYYEYDRCGYNRAASWEIKGSNSGVINTYDFTYNGPFCEIKCRFLDFPANNGSAYYRSTEGRMEKIEHNYDSGFKYTYYSPSHAWGEVHQFDAYVFNYQLSNFKNKSARLLSDHKDNSDKISDIENQIETNRRDLAATKKSLAAEIKAIEQKINNRILETNAELSKLKKSLVDINYKLKETEEALSQDKMLEKCDFLYAIGEYISFEGRVEDAFLKEYSKEKFNLGYIKTPLTFSAMSATTSAVTSRSTASLVPDEEKQTLQPLASFATRATCPFRV